MALPELRNDGYLPAGIHSASLAEVATRFGFGSEERERQVGMLRAVVEATRPYPTIKRILLWGSFVTAKQEPADLDYSVVVAATHPKAWIAPEHRRFLVPFDARLYYGVDKIFLVIPDYPLDAYVEKMEFLSRNRNGLECGMAEISLRGEFAGG